jgi:ribosome-binding ATPase YchF (GTP1/OBG family)
MGDLDAFHTECVFADLEIVDKRLARAKKEQASPAEITAFQVAHAALETERPLRSIPEAELDRAQFKGFGLLSDRPLLVAVNVGEDRAAAPMRPDLQRRIGELSAAGLTLSASVEADISTMGHDEQKEFLRDLGVETSALDRFIRTAYGLLDLISFFTVGPDEVRAWPIKRGMNARQAAGRIHSDLERGFIRAEVIPYDVFMAHGSEQAVKTAGLLQIEGKDYVVADGDILHVRFNV